MHLSDAKPSALGMVNVCATLSRFEGGMDGSTGRQARLLSMACLPEDCMLSRTVRLLTRVERLGYKIL